MPRPPRRPPDPVRTVHDLAQAALATADPTTAQAALQQIATLTTPRRGRPPPAAPPEEGAP